MVEHTVTIDHEFTAPCGANVLVHVDTATGRIEIGMKLAGRSMDLSAEEIGQLADLFGQVQDFLDGKPSHITGKLQAVETVGETA